METDIVGPRPSVEQFADELLALGEFRGLQLGSWLGTTQGEVIAQAVEMVTPPFYRQDVELLVAALTYAARLQSEEGRRAAGKFALQSIGAACLEGFFSWSMEHGSTSA